MGAFATLGQQDENLFAALAREAELQMSEFDVQSIANTAWAFATLRQLDQKLFAAFARQTELRVSEFKAQGIANTAWAFAMQGQLNEKLFMSHLQCLRHLRSPHFWP